MSAWRSPAVTAGGRWPTVHDAGSGSGSAGSQDLLRLLPEVARRDITTVQDLRLDSALPAVARAMSPRGRAPRHAGRRGIGLELCQRYQVARGGGSSPRRASPRSAERRLGQPGSGVPVDVAHRCRGAARGPTLRRGLRGTWSGAGVPPLHPERRRRRVGASLVCIAGLEQARSVMVGTRWPLVRGRRPGPCRRLSGRPTRCGSSRR